jgi:PadR family transcriptional regulator, regulatory protein AphA
MSTPSPTARVILGLLAWGPHTGYEIKRVTDRSTRFFWGASYGQIYPELRRLEQRGLVDARDEPRGKVRRRVYTLTDLGRAELEEWLRDESDVFELRDEGLLRLFFGDLVEADELHALAVRRASVFETSAELFRGFGSDMTITGPTAHVLRYGIELMDWNAAWWRDAARRLSEDGAG